MTVVERLTVMRQVSRLPAQAPRHAARRQPGRGFAWRVTTVPGSYARRRQDCLLTLPPPWTDTVSLHPCRPPPLAGSAQPLASSGPVGVDLAPGDDVDVVGGRRPHQDVLDVRRREGGVAGEQEAADRRHGRGGGRGAAVPVASPWRWPARRELRRARRRRPRRRGSSSRRAGGSRRRSTRRGSPAGSRRRSRSRPDRRCRCCRRRRRR